MTDPGGLDLDLLERAAERLRRGGVVAFPTETVYGLGADATNPDAISEVFRLKGRPSNNPLIVHVTGPEMAAELVERWTPRAERLARAFWPGPLTLVLPRRATVPGVITGGGPTVAVRAPDHPMAGALLFTLGRPLVGPSANRSGGVSPTRAEHVREAFDAERVMVLDGGACAMGIESTVIDLSGPTARVLRPGVIGAAALSEALGEGVLGGGELSLPTGDGALAAPGMLASHYAPRTRAVMVDPEDLEEVCEDHGRVVVLAYSLRVEVAPPHTLVRLPAGARDYAAALYSALREADAQGADLIALTPPPTSGETEGETAIWQAVHDRLRRATA
jgi:L-threonylcarbamoyladenylate synthase